MDTAGLPGHHDLRAPRVSARSLRRRGGLSGERGGEHEHGAAHGDDKMKSVHKAHDRAAIRLREGGARTGAQRIFR